MVKVYRVKSEFCSSVGVEQTGPDIVATGLGVLDYRKRNGKVSRGLILYLAKPGHLKGSNAHCSWSLSLNTVITAVQGKDILDSNFGHADGFTYGTRTSNECKCGMI